jgi:FkbM family methyltransferase
MLAFEDTKEDALGWLAKVLDRALVVYGRCLPYHPKKLHIVAALDRVARSAWTVPRTARLQGVQYEFLPSSWVARSIYYLGDWEHWDTRYFKRTIKPGWTVIDVGSNLGYYALLASRLVGPHGRVFAFEPTPSTFRSLVKNVALNDCHNIRPYQAALSDSCGQISVIEDVQDDYNRIAVRDETGRHRVPCITLDAFVEEQRIERIDLIKVDIEGAEHKFLVGARKTIERFRPIVAIELNPKVLSVYGTTVADLVNELRGYRFYRATWRGFGPLRSEPRGDQTFNAVALPCPP